MTAIERIRDAVLPIVSALDVELYDLELVGSALRLTLDRPGGISLDVITEATRQVSAELDLLDPIDGRYTLEVSSPGLERTLRTAAHWQRAVSEQVKVKVRKEIEGQRRFEGTVLGVGETSCTLDVDGRDKPLELDLETIERARTCFEWGPAPKPGAKSGAKPDPKSGAKSGAEQRPETTNESESA